MLILAGPPINNSGSSETVIYQNILGFNFQGDLDIINVDLPFVIDGIDLSVDLSFVKSFNWGVAIY